MISAILLAAGQAKRMGKLKQLLPLGKSTLLEQTLDNLLQANLTEVVVVLGYRAEEIRAHLRQKRVRIANNPVFSQGMSTSIAAGLGCISKNSAAVLLALADLPFVEASTINLLLDTFRCNDKGILIPTYKGKRGHPVIISLKYRGVLLDLKGDVGAREIIRRYPGDILEVPVDSPGIVQDVDTEEDYLKIEPNAQ